MRKEEKKERCGGEGVVENSLGRRNIPMELRMRDSRSSLFEKKKPGVLDDRRMSLGIKQASKRWQIGSGKEDMGCTQKLTRKKKHPYGIRNAGF